MYWLEKIVDGWGELAHEKSEGGVSRWGPPLAVLLGDRIPEFRLLRLSTLHVVEVDLAESYCHSIMTSTFSLVSSSSKKSLSPLSRRASIS